MNPDQIKQDIKKLESYRVITSDELKSFLNDVANVLTKWKSATFDLNKETKETLNLIVKQVNAEHDRILANVEKASQESKSSVTEEMAKTLALCKGVMEQIKAMKPKDGETPVKGIDYFDGEDADEEKVIKEVLKKIPQEIPKEIKDKLESLQGDKRLDRSAIKGLEKVVFNEDLDRAISILDQRSQYLINKTVKHDATLSGDGSDASPLSVVSGSGITLKTNGVTNGSQTILNLKAGTNMTLTDDGSGQITFDATGGSGIVRSVNVISSPTTAGATSTTDYVYLVSGTTTVTLPTAAGNTNRYTIKRVGTNTVTVATTSSQTIDGSATASINVQYQSLDFISNGSNWNLI